MDDLAVLCLKDWSNILNLLRSVALAQVVLELLHYLFLEVVEGRVGLGDYS